MKWKSVMAQVGRIERPFKITLLYSNCGAQEVGLLAVGSLKLRNCFHGMLQCSQVWNNQMQSEERAAYSPKLIGAISRSDRTYVKTESALEFLAVLTSQELYLHVFCVCTHMYMYSKGRAEVQNCRTAFSGLLYIIFVWESNRAHAASCNRDGENICLDYFSIYYFSSLNSNCNSILCRFSVLGLHLPNL